MLPGIPAESAPYLGRLRLLLELVDLASLSDRLTVNGVLEPFDHGFEVLDAFLHALETRRVLVAAGSGGDARLLSARAESNRDAFEHPRYTPCPLNW
jgi:hypothetical protein